jgi:predicted dehydrogenase
MMANDKIQIALIGAGGMGQGDATMATSLDGVKLIAACDVYTGRLQRAKEKWGADILTTKDYREVLARKDVDAVIIGTPDHWHSTITCDALAAGKHVYCEKPMVQLVSEGKKVIEAQKNAPGKVFQVGSQYVSSVVYQKARDLYKQGAIGELNMVEAWLDRNTALGAWQYSIPPDASEQTVDWERFLGRAPKRPFEAVRVFRWRNYKDYGTGLAGDLYVHLLSGLHTVTGSKGPERIFAMGGTRFWKDGRDAPDVMLATLDYPGFTLMLRVNFESSKPQEDFGFRFVGSEGVMWTSMAEVKLAKQPREKEPGLTIDTFPKAIQERMLKEYRAKHPKTGITADTMRAQGETVYPSQGHNAHLEHHKSFYNSIRQNKPSVEDAVFGFRAAGPALLTNTSMETGAPCLWNPETMTSSSV